MIRKLRRKLMVILISSLTLILCGILAVVNIFNYNVNMNTAYDRLDRIVSAVMLQHSRFDHFFNNNQYYYYDDNNYEDTDIYIAFSDLNGNITDIATKNGSDYSYSEIEEFATTVLEGYLKKGKYQNLIYEIRKTEYNGFSVGYAVGFMDNRANLDNFRHMIIISVVIFIVGMLLIVIISVFVSKWIVQPVSDTFDRQKQFISDASHELKTPIAVISANADMLESDIGENKWLSYIRSESDRMSKLINSLLTLTRIEMQGNKTVMTKFDICNAIMEVTMPFESVAFEKGIVLECEPEDEIFINGNEQQIKQVVAILTDNAVKHCYEGGKVVVSAESLKAKCLLRVSNDGEPVPFELRERIFERFFRADESRSRESHRYGLGLAIAKQIVENHKGTITVKCHEGVTSFEVLLPC